MTTKAPSRCVIILCLLLSGAIGSKALGCYPTKGFEGKTALHQAAERGDLDQVRSLLSSSCGFVAKLPIVFNWKDDAGNTPLHGAACSGDPEIVRILLPDVRDINVVNKEGKTALDIAICKGHCEVAQLLISKGASIRRADSYNQICLMGLSACMQEFIGNSCTYDNVRKDILHHSPADPVFTSCNENDISLQRITELFRAISEGNILEVDSLLDQKVNIEASYGDHSSALHCAIANGRQSIVEILISAGAKLDSKDSQGNTALHWAAKSAHVEIMQMLLATGQIGINARNNAKKTALYIAALIGHADIAKILLQRGAKYTKAEGEPPIRWDRSIVQDIFCWAYYNKLERELLNHLKEAGAVDSWADRMLCQLSLCI